jgi:hypothetical protein
VDTIAQCLSLLPVLLLLEVLENLSNLTESLSVLPLECVHLGVHARCLRFNDGQALHTLQQLCIFIA